MDIQQKIINLIKGKDVIELGGLGDFDIYEKDGFKNWNHVIFKKYVKKIKGIDIKKEFVALARKNGFDYIYGDLEKEETINAAEKFDIALLFDVIEHLNNVGLALTNIRKLLKENGLLVITTPSPWAFNNVFRILTLRSPNILADHTSYIVKENFIELFKRHGYKVEEINYFTFKDQRFPLKSFIIKLLSGFNPLLNSNILIIAKKKS